MLEPLPADRKHVAGSSTNYKIKAVDNGYQNKGVPDLPLELEVVSGLATFLLANNTPR